MNSDDDVIMMNDNKDNDVWQRDVVVSSDDDVIMMNDSKDNDVWQRDVVSTGTSFVSTAPIVGIDFGTSNSCIAVWNPMKNRVKVIKNTLGLKLLPSTVQFYGADFNSVKTGILSSETDVPIVTNIKSYLGGGNNLIEENGKFKLLCYNGIGATQFVDIAEICSFF